MLNGVDKVRYGSRGSNKNTNEKVSSNKKRCRSKIHNEEVSSTDTNSAVAIVGSRGRTMTLMWDTILTNTIYSYVMYRISENRMKIIANKR